jgi:hypothetical protein
MILTMMLSFSVTSYAGKKSDKSSAKAKTTKVVKHKKETKKQQHVAKKSHNTKKGMTAAERKALAKRQVEKARREVAARKAKEKKLPEKVYPSIDERSDSKLAYKEKHKKAETVSNEVADTDVSTQESSLSYEAPVASSSEENTERDIASVEESTQEKDELDDFQFIDDKESNTETMDVSDAGDSDGFED